MIPGSLLPRSSSPLAPPQVPAPRPMMGRPLPPQLPPMAPPPGGMMPGAPGMMPGAMPPQGVAPPPPDPAMLRRQALLAMLGGPQEVPDSATTIPAGINTAPRSYLPPSASSLHGRRPLV